MRILIDATSVLLRSAGIKTHTYYWIQHLWQQAGNEHILTFPRLGRLNALDHERSILSPFETYRRLALLYTINTSVGVPVMRWMTRKADVFHVSNQIRKPPKKVKLTATIHDMTSLLMPELHTQGNVRADASFTENVLKRADLTVLDDANAKADLYLDGEVTVAPVKPDKQHVKVVWHVRRADGAEIGTVGQENDVPKGLLDGPWGDVAYSVAIAAADGLAQLIARGAPEGKS